MTASYTEYFDGGGSWLFPDHSPITAITSIHEDEDWEWASDTEIDSEYYRAADSNSIYYDGIFTKGPQSIKVVYTAGYTASNLPEDLKQASIIEVARIVKHRQDFDVLSANRDDGTVQFTNFDYLPQTLKTLYRYRKVYVA